MGIIQFFEQCDYKHYEPITGNISYEDPVIGQFCWVPIFHLDEIPRILDVERDDPRGHRDVKFKIRNMTPNDFKGKGRLPLKLMNLRDNQEAVIQGASKRPSILLKYGATAFDDIARLLPSMGKKHLQREKIMVVLPLFGVQDDNEHFGGFPPIMVARIRAMMYEQFFYFPKSKDSPLSYDSIGRLDSIQITINNYNACSFEPYKLSNECLGILLAMVKRWFSLEYDEDFEALVEICKESCPESALPT